MRRAVGGTPKRIFDIGFAALAILSLLVPMLVIAFLIKIGSKGPVFFVHRRIGLNGRAFPCLKFRTMVVDADLRLAELLATDADAAEEYHKTRKLRKDPRIIPIVGSILRKLSLDELPQFFNVLVGHMSVVGPRRSPQRRSPGIMAGPTPISRRVPASPGSGRSPVATIWAMTSGWGWTRITSRT